MAEGSVTNPQTEESSSVPNSQTEHLKSAQAPTNYGFVNFPNWASLGSLNTDVQLIPIMYPAFVPGLIPPPNQDQNNRGAGIYAVPVLPFGGPMGGIPTGTLIPLTYDLNAPTRQNTVHATAAAGGGGAEQAVRGRQRQNPQQRQVVVRRFQFGFQLDLFLILKLAAVVFVFNQDGSRERLFLLLLFASFVYLYQTGALTPLIRWLQRGVPRPGAVPPQPPVPRPDGEHAPGQENNADNNGNQAQQNVGVAEGGLNLWGILREIQLVVVGFLSSLLPGFHNPD
ncbi:uncharacterized protein LOC18440693 isoform X1 [Amborella trichopoda]|uniref:Uncharacterized protein n=1 Tax=Amborella trichopoda TaxID=13333 RepID=W1PYA6_AMBTC|nr:uncharacterized protein LOC18440693 isoform X1 [Amborella trichopoda]ERN12475.1 hypothetical protein AMTR_s00025p00164280 [Amborella trichopoda]|eukprot:XP_006850894.1 uncharacterized protein LOC18440693 isoform X1 [Amborella trichopoda]